jgi:hypothetical protein
MKKAMSVAPKAMPIYPGLIGKAGALMPAAKASRVDVLQPLK